MSTASKLLEGSDIGPKFERIRRVFEEEFSVLPHNDKIHMLLQVTTQQAAILISEGVREAAREAGVESPDFLSFFVSAKISADNTSIEFTEILENRMLDAVESILGRMHGG